MSYSWHKLLSDIPGAIPVGALTFAVLNSIVLRDAPDAVLVPISVIAALALTRLGSLWDDVLFDGLYSTQVGGSSKPWLFSRDLGGGRWEGRLVHSERVAVLPPGAELDRSRADAAISYQAAKSAVEDAGRWNEVRFKLEVSKFCRALPVPFLIAAVFAFVEGGSWTRWGVVLVVLAPLALVAFLHLRVEHMTTLYRIAAETGRRDAIK